MVGVHRFLDALEEVGLGHTARTIFYASSFEECTIPAGDTTGDLYTGILNTGARGRASNCTDFRAVWLKNLRAKTSGRLTNLRWFG
jgi:hypothetical protein